MISRTRVFSFQFKSIFFNASLCTTGNIKYWSLGNTQGKREIIVWSDNLKPLVSSIQVKLLKNRIKLLMYWRYYCSLYRTRQNHDNLIFTRILLYNNINDSLKAEKVQIRPEMVLLEATFHTHKGFITEKCDSCDNRNCVV